MDAHRRHCCVAWSYSVLFSPKSAGHSVTCKLHFKMADHWPSLIEQFVSVTGTSKKIAKSMLEACNGNLEMAIEMHLDSDSAAQAGTSTAGVGSTSSEMWVWNCFPFAEYLWITEIDEWLHLMYILQTKIESVDHFVAVFLCVVIFRDPINNTFNIPL